MRYVWRCKQCGSETIIDCVVADRDIPPTDTLYCDEEHKQPHQYERQLTAPTFRLAGGGWFKDGYSKENKK
jgi:predicted nucleic acid-binding Zn ribbon protein